MDKVNNIIKILKLNDLFPDLNKDLILLAVSSSVNDKSFLKRLNLLVKYGSYQTLEFYGDTMLDFIIVDYLLKNFGLNISPGDLTRFKQQIVKNDNLTSISKKTGICSLLTKSKRLEKHNICSDTFEAIIGALYHQYGYQRIRDISSWLFSISELEKMIHNIWIEQISINRAEQITGSFDSMMISKNYDNDEEMFLGFLEKYQERYGVEYFYDYEDDINRYVMKKGDSELTIFFFTEEEPNIDNINEGIDNLREYGIMIELPTLNFPADGKLNEFLSVYLNIYHFITKRENGNRTLLHNKINSYVMEYENSTMKKSLREDKIWI